MIKRAETYFVIRQAVTSTTLKVNEIFGFTLFEQLKPYNETDYRVPPTTCTHQFNPIARVYDSYNDRRPLYHIVQNREYNQNHKYFARASILIYSPLLFSQTQE